MKFYSGLHTAHFSSGAHEEKPKEAISKRGKRPENILYFKESSSTNAASADTATPKKGAQAGGRNAEVCERTNDRQDMRVKWP
ncbi:hypothetical protein R5R35_001985 [Gryllus longicercus]|uniref:Uncharacterized protein n=1 Tax=Gryllus longicercus TaxID=2509291 RepID=A0AAN9VLA5_9ORTH